MENTTELTSELFKRIKDLIIYRNGEWGDGAKIIHALQVCKIGIHRRDEKTGDSLLHIAAYHNICALATYLLDNGIDIHILNNDGCSSLWNAIDNRHIEMIKLLISRGANIYQYMNGNRYEGANKGIKDINKDDNKGINKEFRK